MPPLGQLLLSVWPPLLVAVPLLLLGWWRGQRPWVNGLAVGGGWLAALVALNGWPRMPPVTGTEWLVFAVVVAGLLGAVDARLRAPSALAHGAVLLLVAATVFLTTRRLASGWPPLERALQWAVQGSVLLALTAAAAEPAERGGPLTTLHWTVVAAGASFVLATGSALLGQLAGGLAAVLGACTAVACLRPGFRLGRGAAFPAALALGGLLIGGHLFADVAALPLLCVATASAAGWLAAALQGSPAPVRWLAVVGGSAVLLGAAVALVGGIGGLRY